MNIECSGYTLTAGNKCFLHKTTLALHHTRGKQVGITDRNAKYSLYCQQQKRLRRCKAEPKCNLDCLRKVFFKILDL